MSTYLKTTDFHNTTTSLIDTTSTQKINGDKIFSKSVKFTGSEVMGRGSIQIMPRDDTLMAQSQLLAINGL